MNKSQTVNIVGFIILLSLYIWCFFIPDRVWAVLILFILMMSCAIIWEFVLPHNLFSTRIRQFILLLIAMGGVATFVKIHDNLFELLGVTDKNSGLFSGIITILISAPVAYMLWHWRNIDKQQDIQLNISKQELAEKIHTQETEDRDWNNYIKFQRIASGHNNETDTEKATAVYALNAYYYEKNWSADFPINTHAFFCNTLNNYYQSLSPDDKNKMDVDELPPHIKAISTLVSEKINSIIRSEKELETFKISNLFLPNLHIENSKIKINLKNSVLIGANFQNIQFVPACSFDKTTFIYSKFIDVEIDYCYFTETKFLYSVLVAKEAKKTWFFNTLFNYCELDGSFIECDFSISSFFKTQYIGNFYYLKEANLVFEKCIFSNIYFINSNIFQQKTFSTNCEIRSINYLALPISFVNDLNSKKIFLYNNGLATVYNFIYDNYIKLQDPEKFPQNKREFNIYFEYRRSKQQRSSCPDPSILPFPLIAEIIALAYEYENSLQTEKSQEQRLYDLLKPFQDEYFHDESKKQKAEKKNVRN